jgi:tetratricopeptide (TPR) repeat protein
MIKYVVPFILIAGCLDAPSLAQSPPGYTDAEQGYAAYEARRFSDAVSLTERAVQAQPANRSYWDLLARSLVALGDLNKAFVVAEEAETRAGANPLLWLEIGYGAQAQADFALASRALTNAIAGESGFDASTRLRARLTLADVSLRLQSPSAAIQALKPFADQRLFEVQSRRAYALSTAGDKMQAAEAFGLAAEAASDPASLAAMRRSEALTFLEAGDKARARSVFNAAVLRGELAGSPDLDTALVAVAVGNDDVAFSAFGRAADTGGLVGARALDAGYTALRLQERAAAVRFFSLALQSVAKRDGALSPGQVLQTTREIDGLTRRWGVNGSLMYGTNGDVASDISSRPTGAQLQGGGELTYGLGSGPNRRSVQAFTRLFSVLAADSDQTSGARTIQGWLGLKWRPLERQDLVLEGSRLLKLGRESQQDWLVRASYSISDGRELAPKSSGWLSARLFADVAHLLESDRSFLFVDGRVGSSQLLHPATATILTPFWGGVLFYDSALDTQRAALGTGPGLALRRTLPALRTGIGIPVEAILQYRLAVGESSRAKGLFASLSFSY